MRIIIFILAIITVILFIVFLFIPGARTFPFLRPLPNAPTPIPVSPSVTSLRVVEILPKNLPNQVFFPVQEFNIEFNAQVLPENVQYSITPDAQMRIRQGSRDNIVIISPQTVWKPGESTLTIGAGTKSTKGLLLQQPVSYTFTSNFPENPVEEKQGAGSYPPQEVIDRLKAQYSNQ